MLFRSEIWQVNPASVSEVLNGVVTLESEQAEEFINGLDDFDFDDI